jgi:hypothetical protein
MPGRWHATIHVAQVSSGHAARTLIRLEQDVFPWLGRLPIGEIKAPQLLQATRRVEARVRSKRRIASCRPAVKCSDTRSQPVEPNETRHLTCAVR